MDLGHVCFVGRPQVHVTESLMLRGSWYVMPMTDTNHSDMLLGSIR